MHIKFCSSQKVAARSHSCTDTHIRYMLTSVFRFRWDIAALLLNHWEMHRISEFLFDDECKACKNRIKIKIQWITANVSVVPLSGVWEMCSSQPPSRRKRVKRIALNRWTSFTPAKKVENNFQFVAIMSFIFFCSMRRHTLTHGWLPHQIHFAARSVGCGAKRDRSI